MAEAPWIAKDRPEEELDTGASGFERMRVPESRPPPRAMGGVDGAPRVIFYNRVAQRRSRLYGRGIPQTDIGKIVRGEIPWPN